jgi:hypothetical protein
VIVEDSHRLKGGRRLRTTVFNDIAESRANNFPFIGRLSWRPLA